MYKLEPIISFSNNTSLPTCMYKVNNIHEHRLDCTTNDPFQGTDIAIDEQVMRLLQKPSEATKMIEERQKKLLQQLECLRSQMLKMKQNILSCQQNNVESAAQVLTESDLPKDIVITADPKWIPYYLLALQKTLKLNISCHTHSSVISLSPALDEFVKKINLGNMPGYAVNIVLIWKSVGVGTKLSWSTVMPVLICGDVNVMRYLTTVSNSHLSYNHLDNAWKLDSILDMCHHLQWNEGVKQKQALLQALSVKLGKNQWMNGESKQSIGDIALWSTIKQRDFVKDLPTNLITWFKKCETSS